MATYVCLTGRVFGRWTVLERAPGDGKVRYKCRCECGNTATIRGTSLTSGDTTSCGCNRREQTFKDLTGKTFGRLTVIERIGAGRPTIWLVRCSCGVEKTVQGAALNSGDTTSCGCYNREIHSKDLVGQTFGRLTVLCRDGMYSPVHYHCECVCGAETVVRASHLTSGEIVSCGCWNRDKMFKHGHGMRGHFSPTYISWAGMKNRCDNRNEPSYPDYGGRGITYDPRWADFETFLHDVGHRPEFHTLDRIDPNGNYEPGNVRWATDAQQANNTRRSRHITWNGETHTCAEWSRIVGISEGTIWARIKVLGWTPEQALQTPADQSGVKRANSQGRKITSNGETRTAKEWSALTGIPKSTILERLRNRWTTEEALSTPVDRSGVRRTRKRR